MTRKTVLKDRFLLVGGIASFSVVFLSSALLLLFVNYDTPITFETLSIASALFFGFAGIAFFIAFARRRNQRKFLTFLNEGERNEAEGIVRSKETITVGHDHMAQEILLDNGLRFLWSERLGACQIEKDKKYRFVIKGRYIVEKEEIK